MTTRDAAQKDGVARAAWDCSCSGFASVDTDAFALEPFGFCQANPNPHRTPPI
jgi:hypothetical protein